MNDVLLINRIDVQKEFDKKKKIFFIVDYKSEDYSEYNIVKLLSSLENIRSEDIVFRYNGFQIQTEIRNIPAILKALMDEKVPVYSVFEMYTPVV
ncbi:hypothetical protein C3V37_03585 [Peptostreptococcaceae bacterium oral taxon 929]|uniref:Uncharacterized protein n=1 Tax=Fenollaria massiliensis TaxID=938288 RepID=A0A9E7DJK2_9FIRM|nr:hypothetical protein [Fenollaria massiliensis]AVM66960.1 hypothetical protein C3V37_03585 [Peptostreptococcaceae bacterium oral taxon 929]UQK59367.1 hypothetical protein M1R53_01460 [Fenollaria massiliensis]